MDNDNNLSNTPKINAATILRTAALAFALTNQVFHSLGRPFLPIDNEEAQSLITIALTVGAAMTAWWHNNSFTKHARHADSYLKKLLHGQIACSELQPCRAKKEPDNAD